MTKNEIEELRIELLRWYVRHHRDLPWRRTNDPYPVWVSEIMLQQTRVAAATPYYERFMARFPSLQSLAEAPEAELLALWAGLGYYHRARNMQKAARLMHPSGSFPSTHEGIRALPGIGDYTAAALASISFGLPHAVVDGNVFRVLSRLYNDSTNIVGETARKRFALLAGALLDPAQPGNFNQAMMELGATICVPRNPQCLVCPVAQHCQARKAGRQNDLPVKIVPRRSIREHRAVFWIEHDGYVLLWRRSNDASLMAGFYELPERDRLPGLEAGSKIGSFRHSITIRNLTFDVFEAPVPHDIISCQWLAISNLQNVPLSTIVRKAIRAVQRSREQSGPTALTAGA